MVTATNKHATAKVLGTIAQTGTTNPILTPFVNTIGTISILRLAPGQYMINNTTGEYIVGKTIINNTMDGINPMLLSLTAINDYFIQFNVLSAYSISMDVKNAAGTRVELSSLQGGTLQVLVNIEVYNYIIPTT